MGTVIVAGLTALLLGGQAAGTGVIAGRILEEGTNQPIPDARVTIVPQAPRMPFGPPRETMSDAAGRYVFDGLEPGGYRIAAQKSGYAGPDPFQRPTLITVAAGQTIGNVNQVLQRGAVIAGRVIDEGGNPVVEARVQAFRRPPANPSAPQGRLVPAGQSVATNDLGEFRVFGLAPGDYYIQAAPRPDSPLGNAAPRPTTLAATFYPSTADAAAASPIAVGGGQTVNDILVAMLVVPAYRISGIVVDENGQPVADAMIMLMRDPMAGAAVIGPAPGRARSDASGRFSIVNVISGTYLLSAAAPVVVSTGGDKNTDAAGGRAIGGGVTGGIGAGTAGGISSGPGNWSSWETRGGTTVTYQADGQTRLIVNDANIEGLQLTAKRAR